MDDPGSLQLVRDSKDELRDALLSVVGRDCKFQEKYLLYAAGFVHSCAVGFIQLREAGAFSPSRLMIRPAIEVAIYSFVIRRDPSRLVQKAYDEHKKDKKWARGLGTKLENGVTLMPDVEEVLKQIDDQWTAISAMFAGMFPGVIPNEGELDARSAAESVRKGFYDRFYRLYSNYTHGTLRAISGQLSPLDGEDNWAMAICTMTALDHVVALGGAAPNYAALQDRLKAIP